MSFVQDISASAAVASGTSIAKAITGVTAGNLLRVVVGYFTSGSSVTISVSDGTHTYTAATTLFFDGLNDLGGLQEFYLPNAPGGSSTITATFGGATTDQFIYIQERSGIATSSALNVAGTVSNTVPGSSGANVVIANSITTTGGTTDVCGFVMDGNGASVFSAGTTLAWTGRSGNPWPTQAGKGQMSSEDLSAQSASSYVATFGITASGGRYYTYAVAYNNASSGAALAGAASDTTSAAGALSTGIPLAAAASDATSAAGALSTGIPLAGAASDATTAAGALSTGAHAWTLDTTSITLDSNVATLDGYTGPATLAASATDAVSAAGQLINFSSVTLTAPLYTGVGGIFDPNLTWPYSTPVVGSVVYYDPTAGGAGTAVVLPNGEINCSSNNCVIELQYNDGTHLNEVDVFLTPLMVGYASDVTAATGSLISGAAQLIGAATTLTAAVGALTTGIKLASLAADVTSAAGALMTAIQLVATAADTTTSSGNLVGTGAPLSGAAADATIANANLTAQIKLSAAASNVITAVGALSAQILFVAQANDSTAAAGTLSTGVVMAGAASDSTTGTGLLGSIQKLFAAANDVTSAAGSLLTQITLAASASSTTLAAAALGTDILMDGDAVSDTTGAGALGVLQLTTYPNRVLRTSYMPLYLGAQAGPLPYGEFFADVGDVVLYGIDWQGWLANYWQRDASIPAGQVIRGRTPNGYEFSTVAGGQSGNVEPIWPSVVGQTVQDGSTLWVCQAMDTTSLSATVVSCSWEVPAGILVDGQEITGQTVIVMLDASEAVSGTNYTVNGVTVMSDGEVKVGRIVLKVR